MDSCIFPRLQLLSQWISTWSHLPFPSILLGHLGSAHYDALRCRSSFIQVSSTLVGCHVTCILTARLLLLFRALSAEELRSKDERCVRVYSSCMYLQRESDGIRVEFAQVRPSRRRYSLPTHVVRRLLSYFSALPSLFTPASVVVAS